MSAKQISLFFLWKAFGAGTTNYTAHLYKGLKLAGYRPSIYRVGLHTESFERSFASFEGVKYRNIDFDTARRAVRHDGPSLLCAPAPAKHLVRPDLIMSLISEGMRVSIHGALDWKIYEKLDVRDMIDKPICVRAGLAKQWYGEFIPHPYERTFDAVPNLQGRKYNAVSIARITFVKNIETILAANRQLKPDQRILLLGNEDRLYTRVKIAPNYPEFKQGSFKGFKPSFDGGPHACKMAVYAVDMSSSANHVGGGSQYTFLEAWDAGAVNVINRDWLAKGGEMIDGDNCLTAEDPRELALVMRTSTAARGDIVRNGRKAMMRHDAQKIAEHTWEVLNA